MQETILVLRQQIDSLSNKMSGSPEQMAENDGIPPKPCSEEISQQKNAWRNGLGSCEETFVDEHTPTSVMSLNRIFSHEESNLNSQVLMQVNFTRTSSAIGTQYANFKTVGYMILSMQSAYFFIGC